MCGPYAAIYWQYHSITNRAANVSLLVSPESLPLFFQRGLSGSRRTINTYSEIALYSYSYLKNTLVILRRIIKIAKYIFRMCGPYAAIYWQYHSITNRAANVSLLMIPETR